MPTPRERFEDALQKNASAFGVRLDQDAVTNLSRYYDLVHKWNHRMHLVAPCSPEEFATRHVLESLMLLPHLAQDARIVDVGSGAGLPAIPCAIARADLRAFLIESSRKKAVFLREAVRQLDLHQRAEVSANRFERIAAPEAEAVTSRALDRFQELLPSLIQWAPPGITLLLFGGENLLATIKSLLPSAQVERMPNSERRFLIVASRPESA